MSRVAIVVIIALVLLAVLSVFQIGIAIGIKHANQKHINDKHPRHIYVMPSGEIRYDFTPQIEVREVKTFRAKDCKNG